MCEIQDYTAEPKDIYTHKYSWSSDMDLYITDSLQDMLDMDIKSEIATDLSSMADFPDTLGSHFSELPPLLDMDTDNSSTWLNNSSSFVHNLDLYGSEANAVMVNPNSVMPSSFIETPVKSVVKEEASNLLLTSAAANDDLNNSISISSPKEEKSHLTFSPNTIKVSKVQEIEETTVNKRSKDLEEATQMVIYVRKHEKAVVKDLLKDLDKSKVANLASPTTVRIKSQPEIIKVNNKNCTILNTSQKVAHTLGAKTIISGNIHILDAQQINNRTILSNGNKNQATILIDNSSLSNSRQIIKTSVGGTFTVDTSQAKFVNTNSKNSSGEFPKPAYSYSCLIAMALKNSRTGSLPVSEIYNFMCQHFPYFKTAPNGWKNSVRHNLSLNKCFEKIEKPSTNGSQRKGCLWAMNPSKVGKMDEEVQKWSRKDPQAIKKAMVYPENLEALERGEMKYSSAGGDTDIDDEIEADVDTEDADVEIDPEVKEEVDEEAIVEQVAQSNKSLNISDVEQWRRDNNMVVTDLEVDDAANVRTMLCMPIVNANKDVIGVAQLINKENGSQFTEGDISLFEAFAIFCGLGIHNTQMYENACKLMAKQKVALECLSYHATASTEDTSKLCNDNIPTAETYNLYSFQFHDFDLSDEDTCRATLRMFLQCNLVEKFHIPYDVLCRWILSVKKNYRPVKYHNWRHALNVAQTMFAMLKTGKMERFMSDLEILGLLVACLCHDLDHRGTNNAFQTKTESPLAILYSTSTMEHHHFDQCVMILNSESNNIFQALSPCDYKDVMRVVETAILSTDLAMYFKKRSKFHELIDDGEFDWQSQEKKELLCGMMMTACDVSAIAKPWEVQHKVAKLVADEFFDQGDLEKLQLNQPPIAMMDREKKDELPQMQVGFIDMICLPLYKVLSDTFPWILPLYSGTMDNRQRWQDLAEKVEMGLTWIDHDTIDKPIEVFTASNEPIKDVEFTVQTLNCSKLPESSSMALAKPFKTSNSLRRGKSFNFTTRPARSKLTRSMYAPSREESREERARQTVTKSPPATDKSRTETGVEEVKKSKGKLCTIL